MAVRAAGRCGGGRRTPPRTRPAPRRRRRGCGSGARRDARRAPSPGRGADAAAHASGHLLLAALLVRLLVVRDGQPLQLGVVVAGDRLLELAHPLPQAATHLGQALGAEEDEGEQAEQQELGHSDESGHVEYLLRAVVAPATLGRCTSAYAAMYIDPHGRSGLADDEPRRLDGGEDLRLAEAVLERRRRRRVGGAHAALEADVADPGGVACFDRQDAG